MDYHQLQQFINTTESSDLLLDIARIYGIQDEPYVLQKLQTLRNSESERDCIPGARPSHRPQQPQHCHSKPRSPQELNHDQIGRGQEQEPYVIRRQSTRTFARTAAVEETYRIKFSKSGAKIQDSYPLLRSVLDHVIDKMKKNLGSQDLMRVVVRQQTLNGHLVVPLDKASKFDSDHVLTYVENLVSSKQNITIDDSFNVDVGGVRVVQGSGYSNLAHSKDSKSSLRKKRSIVEIKNQDDPLCLARAVGVCFCRVNMVPDTEWAQITSRRSQADTAQTVLDLGKAPRSFYENVRKSTSLAQKSLARRICQGSGIPSDTPLNLTHIPKLEKFLHVQIVVVSSEQGNKIITPERIYQDGRKKLFLYYVRDLPDNEGHFHSILKPTGFFCTSYFCENCLKPYENRHKHSCDITCIVCKTPGCKESINPMSCALCHFTCRSEECFLRHKQPEVRRKGKRTEEFPSQCQTWWRCNQCFKVVNKLKTDLTKNPHSCETYLCESCQNYVHHQHLCYTRATPPTAGQGKLVFIDLETRFDELNQCSDLYKPGDKSDLCQNCRSPSCGRYVHVVNLAVAKTCCEKCIRNPLDDNCPECGKRCKECGEKAEGEYLLAPCPDTCGQRTRVFDAGDHTVDRFCDWLFHKGFTVVAHNMRGFDHVPVLNYLIRKRATIPDRIIFNGSKMMYMSVGKGLNIRVIDSLSFLNMPLKKIPDAFGLQGAAKGFFPYKFNLKSNQGYRGAYPSPEYYGADQFNCQEREVFNEWYHNRVESGQEFERRNEKILRQRRTCSDAGLPEIQGTGAFHYRSEKRRTVPRNGGKASGLRRGRRPICARHHRLSVHVHLPHFIPERDVENEIKGRRL